jgi:hypothetical protein
MNGNRLKKMSFLVKLVLDLIGERESSTMGVCITRKKEIIRKVCTFC